MVREGACLRVVGMALQGPYSKAGGGLNQCIVRISGRKITEPADLSALVAAQPNGEIIEIELAKAKALRGRNLMLITRRTGRHDEAARR